MNGVVTAVSRSGTHTMTKPVVQLLLGKCYLELKNFEKAKAELLLTVEANPEDSEAHYLLAAALSRPLIARELVRVAAEEGATHVAHGCSAKGNDQIRFETAIVVLAPWRPALRPDCRS